MRRNAVKSKQHERYQLWERFDHLRTQETGGSIKSLESSLVSLTIPTLSTHRDVVQAIANQCQPPIAIESLGGNLSETQFPRGKTIFRLAGAAIDDIAVQYEDMRWWMSKHGLNMGKVPLAKTQISKFDELAGKLYVDGSKNGRLSKELLIVIAKALDEANFSLKDLQPAQWKVISKYNQKNAKHAVKSFEQASRHPRLVRSVRKRLYVARERYNGSITPPPQVS